jgi:hypothetical protein
MFTASPCIRQLHGEAPHRRYPRVKDVVVKGASRLEKGLSLNPSRIYVLHIPIHTRPHLVHSLMRMNHEPLLSSLSSPPTAPSPLNHKIIHLQPTHLIGHSPLSTRRRHPSPALHPPLVTGGWKYNTALHLVIWQRREICHPIEAETKIKGSLGECSVSRALHHRPVGW